jgi:hypothetical protein
VPALSVPAPPGAHVTAIDVIVRVKAGEAPRECPMARFEHFLN